MTPKKTPNVFFAGISLCFTRNYYPVWHCFQSVIFRFQKSFLNICAVKISRSNIYLSSTFECFTANSKVTKIHGKYLLKKYYFLWYIKHFSKESQPFTVPMTAAAFIPTLNCTNNSLLQEFSCSFFSTWYFHQFTS